MPNCRREPQWNENADIQAKVEVGFRKMPLREGISLTPPSEIFHFPIDNYFSDLPSLKTLSNAELGENLKNLRSREREAIADLEGPTLSGRT